MYVSHVRFAATNLEDVQAADSRVIHIHALNVASKEHEVNIMGEVAATIKIMPEGVETDLKELKDKLVAALPAGAEYGTHEEEPIAFGLKAIVMVVIVGDIEGGTEKVEEAFAAVKGVESVTVTEVGRPV